MTEIEDKLREHLQFLANNKSNNMMALDLFNNQKVKSPYYDEDFGSINCGLLENDIFKYLKHTLLGTDMALKDLKEIDFNIWDDYDEEDDGTTGYVEEYSISKRTKEKITRVIYEHLLDIKMEKDSKINNVRFEENYTGEPDIKFSNLTHEKREWLIERLEKSDLKYDGIPICFMSES